MGLSITEMHVEQDVLVHTSGTQLCRPASICVYNQDITLLQQSLTARRAAALLGSAHSLHEVVQMNVLLWLPALLEAHVPGFIAQ